MYCKLYLLKIISCKKKVKSTRSFHTNTHTKYTCARACVCVCVCARARARVCVCVWRFFER